MGVELHVAKKYARKRTTLIVGISTSLFVFLSLITLLVLASKYKNINCKSVSKSSTASMFYDPITSLESMHEWMNSIGSGKLAFCAGEEHVYTVEQLMRAPGELLGRGILGTTYKVMLHNRLIVCVKRLDGGRFAGASRDVFERHMKSVGMLRHQNLVLMRAFYQANEERLLVYDYHPNGSLFSLIHGPRSSRSKPVQWASCLKIAEDIAQGLSYIHQTRRLAHGNLKSSNVLLGSDFMACVTDYCLSAIATIPIDDDPDNTAYRAPEIRNFNHKKAHLKHDVYAFGVVLIELLTGKHPSQHPYLMPNRMVDWDDMVDWVRSTREDSGEDNRFEMLLEVAMACNVPSPEQRPTMWQVLNMLQEIKRVAIMDDVELKGRS